MGVKIGLFMIGLLNLVAMNVYLTYESITFTYLTFFILGIVYYSVLLGNNLFLSEKFH